jgi:hypothetical protein
VEEMSPFGQKEQEMTTKRNCCSAGYERENLLTMWLLVFLFFFFLFFFFKSAPFGCSRLSA